MPQEDNEKMLSGLPVSKSIAQRVLICRALRGESFPPLQDCVSTALLPDDVVVMYNALAALSAAGSGCVSIDVHDNGTALRFLTAYCAQLDGVSVCLDGSPRLRERPLAQLVDTLRLTGADITCTGNEGYAPLIIRGRSLDLSHTLKLDSPLSSQFVSALLLIGAETETDDRSPYIGMTRRIVREQGTKGQSTADEWLDGIERDWSAAAFWLEREVLGLPVPEGIWREIADMSGKPSLQGDSAASELFRRIREKHAVCAESESADNTFRWDFSLCPDLYPAAAVACRELGLHADFTGLERLPYKESDRLHAVSDNFARITRGDKPLSFGDHRIAMAFLAAGYDVDDAGCTGKSYPAFLSQLHDTVRVIPVRQSDWHEGMRRWSVEGGLLTLRQADGGQGKKHALSAAMREVSAGRVWLNDNDVASGEWRVPCSGSRQPDMVILPLRMTAGSGSLLERLEVLEYDAVQSVTLFSARCGHPVMCAGANLLVRREAWLECEPELHPEIPSGDDMFLLEAMKKRGMSVSSAVSPMASVAPEASLRGLFRQRMRWAGKAPHYTDRDIRLCGMAVVLSNLLAAVCPPWLILKWIADTVLIARYRRLTNGAKITAGDCVSTLLLTIIYPWYMLICLIGGLFRKTW